MQIGVGLKLEELTWLNQLLEKMDKLLEKSTKTRKTNNGVMARNCIIESNRSNNRTGRKRKAEKDQTAFNSTQ